MLIPGFFIFYMYDFITQNNILELKNVINCISVLDTAENIFFRTKRHQLW